MSTTHELVPSVSITNLVNQRAAIIEKMTQAFALIREAGDIALASRLGMPDVKMSTVSSRSRYNSEVRIGNSNLGHSTKGPSWEKEKSPEDEALKLLILGIDQGGWQYLMHESGLRSLMDAKAREKWDKAVGEGEIPELNEANIRSTFQMLHDARGEMFERGVIECFKNLSWQYKTNLPQKFGKRIVVTYINGTYGYEKCNQMDDLMRVMCILDGKPEPDHRGGINSMLSSAGLTSFMCKAGEVENDYLKIKVYKNRNGHVTFKRPDLIEKMNKIIAKHYPNALPEPK